MYRGTILVSLACVLLLAPVTLSARMLPPEKADEIRRSLRLIGILDAAIDLNVRVVVPRSMNPHARADATLWATVVMPAERRSSPGPVIFIPSAYRREIFLYMHRNLLKHGYTLVLADFPGTSSSPGTWAAQGLVEHYEAKYFVDNWIPSQEWSDGIVGMIGPSYLALTLLNVSSIVDRDPATGEPTHLKAIFPYMVGADMYEEIGMHGGSMNLEFLFGWISFTNLFALVPPLLLLDDTGLPSPADVIESARIWAEHAVNTPGYYTGIFANPSLELPSPWYFERAPMSRWPIKPDWGLPWYWGFPEGETSFPTGTSIFITGGWFDIFTQGTLNNYRYGLSAHRRGDKAMIIGEWYHFGGVFGVGLPALGQMELPARWFDWKLRGIGTPFMVDFPVVLYVMGANRWRAERDWPLPAGRTEEKTFYLSKRRPSFIPGDWFSTVPWNPRYALVDDPDDIAPGVEDPVLVHRVNPVTWHGYNSRSFPRWLAGAQNLPVDLAILWSFDANRYRPYEDERVDEYATLTFTGEPLEADLEIVGPLLLTFWARTEFVRSDGKAIRGALRAIRKHFHVDTILINQMLERDVQWVANLDDVFPDGRSRNLTGGWLRASRRQYDPGEPAGTLYHDLDPAYVPFDPFYYPPYFNPRFIAENEYYRYAIELWPTCNVFKKGHRVRVSIKGSDFPHLLPSLWASHNTLLIDEEHPATLRCSVANGRDEGVAWKWTGDIDRYLLTHSDAPPGAGTGSGSASGAMAPGAWGCGNEAAAAAATPQRDNPRMLAGLLALSVTLLGPLVLLRLLRNEQEKRRYRRRMERNKY